MQNIPQEIYDLLIRLMGTNDPFVFDTWWHSPNRGLNGLCPCDCDELDVKGYLVGHIEGGW